MKATLSSVDVDVQLISLILWMTAYGVLITVLRVRLYRIMCIYIIIYTYIYVTGNLCKQRMSIEQARVLKQMIIIKLRLIFLMKHIFIF